MSIYVVMESVRTEGYDGRDYFQEVPDLELGYFSDMDSALEYVEARNQERNDRYEESVSKYVKAVEKWQKKSEKAQALGFSNPDSHPSRDWMVGSRPNEFYVEEVKPHG